ncbi:hypothetical protein BGZ99_001095 [Dissophora globulifera]|uniref:Uncharacterized protein n=1 Tax=Dissophora globulifera TaxID=979702 RepID=A0A9P6RTT4_9FUNG|nr:hypothetical protein BGZ99_001095 [Dissophora globulifera]
MQLSMPDTEAPASTKTSRRNSDALKPQQDDPNDQTIIINSDSPELDVVEVLAIKDAESTGCVLSSLKASEACSVPSTCITVETATEGSERSQTLEALDVQQELAGNDISNKLNSDNVSNSEDDDAHSLWLFQLGDTDLFNFESEGSEKDQYDDGDGVRSLRLFQIGNTDLFSLSPMSPHEDSDDDDSCSLGLFQLGDTDLFSFQYRDSDDLDKDSPFTLAPNEYLQDPETDTSLESSGSSGSQTPPSSIPSSTSSPSNLVQSAIKFLAQSPAQSLPLFLASRRSKQERQQRPYSQFQPQSTSTDIYASDASVQDQIPQRMPRRRSHSLSSLPCSPDAVRSSLAHNTVMSTKIYRGPILGSDACEVEKEGKGPPDAIHLIPQGLTSSGLDVSTENEDGVEQNLNATPPLSPRIGSEAPETPTVERPRRQSMLSPRQLEITAQQQDPPRQQQHIHEIQEQKHEAPSRGRDLMGSIGKKSGFSNFIRDQGKKMREKKQLKDQQTNVNATPASSSISTGGAPLTETKSQRPAFLSTIVPKQLQLHPSAPQPPQHAKRNMPVITFQPHSSEILTDQSSVSGRLLLHIPRLPARKFHFVSLALHLRLKETISWTKQDLETFDTEKHNWARTVWDKKMMLPDHDKQVAEVRYDVLDTIGALNGLSPAATIAAAASSRVGSVPGLATGSNVSLSPGSESANKNENAIKNSTVPSVAADMIDEWRWEWLLPIGKKEVRPESFEGMMGMVWYELEAKCHFRWDKLDDEGNVIALGESLQSSSTTNGKESKQSADGKGSSCSSRMFKGLGASTNKSIAQVFGKLRPGNSVKKARSVGDFKLASQHEEFIKDSLKKAREAEDRSKTGESNAVPSLNKKVNNDGSQKLPAPKEPLPFMVRHVTKLYFKRPSPHMSTNPAFFLPQPSMSLPNLPSTRRMKAFIPGARIQVQIQVPSIIPIRGYALTSRLVPCTKTGGLIPSKKGDATSCSDNHQQKPQQPRQPECVVDSRFNYPDNFQAALTVRKVTQHDLDKNDILRRRYEHSEAAAQARKNKNKKSNDSTGQQLGGMNSTNVVNETGSSTSSRWRKEVRVRKVKCEFLQKESVRIPGEDGPKRTVKTALAPIFTFSEKAHEGQISNSQRQQRTVNISTALAPENSGAVTVSHAVGIKKSLNSNFSGPCPPMISGSVDNDVDCKTSVLSPSESLPSVSFSQNPQAMPGKPFMLLIPISLDNPNLRQTYAWPSSEAPAPEIHSHHSSSQSRSRATNSSSLDFGSELDLLSTYGTEEGASNNSSRHAGYSRSNINTNNSQSSAAASKARIEVSQYLSFRVSIDVLEFEGELESDDVDLGAIEEEQLQKISGRYQDLPIQNGIKDDMPSITSSHTNMLASSASIIAAASTVEADEISETTCGSKGSPMTAKLGTSNVTAGTKVDAISRELTPTQTSSSISGGNTSSVSATANMPSSGIHGGGGSLMAGAIGALKKKASGSALANLHTHQPQQPRNGRVEVQRLKDFIIRVPITVFIQVDEQGQVTEAYGRTGSGPEDGVKTSGGIVTNLSSTATTTLSNIVTGSSAQYLDPLQSTSTSNSFASIASSTRSEPVMRRTGDFAGSSSLLTYAGMRDGQGGAGSIGHSRRDGFSVVEDWRHGNMFGSENVEEGEFVVVDAEEMEEEAEEDDDEYLD